MDVGVASGLATIEKAQAEEQLRQELRDRLVAKDEAGAKRLLEQSETKYGLSPTRREEISAELASAGKEPGKLIKPLDKILQSQGDKASEHIKKLEKEFLVLDKEQIDVARTVMNQLKARDLTAAKQTLDHSALPEKVRQSLGTVLENVKHGEITPGQGAFVIGDRVTYSQAHPEYSGKEIKLARFGTQELTESYQELSRRRLAQFPKSIIENGQQKTINVPAFEYSGVYTNSAGQTEQGVVAVISDDGKTVIGGHLKDVLDEAVRLHRMGSYEQAQVVLRQADQIYAQVAGNAERHNRATAQAAGV